jgi:methylglyoxal synthase
MSRKTLIAALASHDSPPKNQQLAEVLFEAMSDKFLPRMKEFAFVFTGGTYKRLFEEFKTDGDKRPWLDRVDDEMKKQGIIQQLQTKERLLKACQVFRLPEVEQGGITILSQLITHKKISIIWPFYTPWTTHLLNPENLAMLRLCDQWHVNSLMNRWSILEWMRGGASLDCRRNIQDLPILIDLIGQKSPKTWDREKPDRNGDGDPWCFFDPDLTEPPTLHDAGWAKGKEPEEVKAILANMRIALISHDEKKDRMVEFVTDYQAELGLFDRIMATGTTGALVRDAAPTLDRNNVHRFNSGPKGGDIEIATEILYGRCHVVIFFTDPLHAHPHTEDIRVVFRACMTNPWVRMLSNEQQAREWMDRTVRRMVP